jgi:hypothetical protein
MKVQASSCEAERVAKFGDGPKRLHKPPPSYKGTHETTCLRGELSPKDGIGEQTVGPSWSVDRPFMDAGQRGQTFEDAHTLMSPQ